MNAAMKYLSKPTKVTAEGKVMTLWYTVGVNKNMAQKEKKAHAFQGVACKMNDGLTAGMF